MKNKLSKLLATFMLLIAIAATIPCIAHAESGFKLIESSEGNTLVVYNEEPGKLINNFKDAPLGKYINLVIEGEIDSFDFKILELMSYNCKTIDLYHVKTNMIPNGAFQRRDNLEKLILPETLKVIGRGAFAHCNNMKIDSLPASLKVIENHAFLYCVNLNLTIPEEIEVGEEVFKHCPNVRLPESTLIKIDNVQPSKTLFGTLLSYLRKWI